MPLPWLPVIGKMKKSQTITPTIGDFKCRYHGCRQLVKRLSYVVVLNSGNWYLYSIRACYFSCFSLIVAARLLRCCFDVVVPLVSARPPLLGILINKFVYAISIRFILAVAGYIFFLKSFFDSIRCIWFLFYVVCGLVFSVFEFFLWWNL